MASIIRQTTVIRDGWHNGFTDLQYWQNCYWVGYRKGSAHVSFDSEAVVAVSVDRVRFREVAKVRLFGDNRDPKLFPIDDQRLAMLIPTWQGAIRGELLQQTITFSEDGFNWETPQPILPKGHWLWRIRRHDGRYYALVQTLRDEPGGGRRIRHGLELWTSTDLLDWQRHCVVGDPELYLNESDIHWHDDGTAWILARTTLAHGCSYLLTAQAPYTEWTAHQLSASIHAPIFLPHHGKLYVSGRRHPTIEGIEDFPSRRSLGVWEVTAEDVRSVLHIPAMGDCSYPGLIKDPAGRICLTYYSQHAYLMGVAEQVHTPDDADGHLPAAADVFFAELNLDDG